MFLVTVNKKLGSIVTYIIHKPGSSRIEKASTNSGMELLQIEQCQKVYRLKVAVNGRRTANPCPNREIGAEQFGNGSSRARRIAQRQIQAWLRSRSQVLPDLPVLETLVDCDTFSGILRCKRRATDQVTRATRK